MDSAAFRKIVHDARNALNILNNNLTLLREDLDDRLERSGDADRSEMVLDCMEAAERLTRIVNDELVSLAPPDLPIVTYDSARVIVPSGDDADDSEDETTPLDPQPLPLKPFRGSS